MFWAMDSASQLQLVFSTAPDIDTARRIADHLVEYRLAACVNLIEGVESVYRWQGELHRDAEILLMIKARKADYPDLEAAIVALHPYELPEIIAVPLINGLSGYLNWVRQQNEAK